MKGHTGNYERQGCRKVVPISLFREGGRGYYRRRKKARNLKTWGRRWPLSLVCGGGQKKQKRASCFCARLFTHSPVH